MSDWKSIKDYATEKGCSTQFVYKLIKQGKLFSKVVAGKKYVSESPDDSCIEGCKEVEKVDNKESDKEESLYRKKMEMDYQLRLERSGICKRIRDLRIKKIHYK